MKKLLLRILAIIVGLFLILVLLLFMGVIWRSPPFYKTSSQHSFEKPIMNMEEYGQLTEDHARPYIFSIRKSGSMVTVLGIEHTKDPANPQIDSISKYWTLTDPTVSLVEGRLGFLFQGLQDPVTELGEGGMTVRLAKKNRIPYYTWEPNREEEVKQLLKKYPARQLALFYSLRPYFSNYRFGKPAHPDATLLQYINERTAVEGLNGELVSVAQVDSIWKADFPGIKDWRNTSDEFGWPPGYLAEIANASNLYRDQHLCSIIVELVEKNERVIVTMGSSHAYRIRQTLEFALK